MVQDHCLAEVANAEFQPKVDELCCAWHSGILLSSLIKSRNLFTVKLIVKMWCPTVFV